MVRVAINGFGRIGRMVYRAGRNHPAIEFVAVNDLTDTKTLAHLLTYDSVHGRIQADVSHDEHSITVDGKKLLVYAQRDPKELPWDELDIDIVIESTGFFRTREKASAHLEAGAKKVVLSAPAKSDDVLTIVMGVNEHDYDEDQHHIVSNASCTTNCLAPLMKVLHDNFGIEVGYFNTIHSYTADQNHVDGPHRDLRRARACATNIVPTTSGAAVAAEKAIPDLQGKVTGMAVRVPTPDGSITDFVCTLERDVTAEEVNELFRNVAEHHLYGIIRYTEDPIVSSDIIGDSHSVIFDAASTTVQHGKNLRVLGWYDNEWGYSCRVIDLVAYMADWQGCECDEGCGCGDDCGC